MTFLLSSSRFTSAEEAADVDDISVVDSLLLLLLMLTFDGGFGLLEADSSELFCETPSRRKRRSRICEEGETEMNIDGNCVKTRKS